MEACSDSDLGFTGGGAVFARSGSSIMKYERGNLGRDGYRESDVRSFDAVADIDCRLFVVGGEQRSRQRTPYNGGE